MDSKLPTTCTQHCPHLNHNFINHHLPTLTTLRLLQRKPLPFIYIFLEKPWLFDTPDAGWHCWGQRLQGALSLSKFDRESTQIKMQAVYRLRYSYSWTSDLVSITISLPATLARFLHTFCKLHRLPSTCVNLSISLCAPRNLNTIAATGFHCASTG